MRIATPLPLLLLACGGSAPQPEAHDAPAAAAVSAGGEHASAGSASDDQAGGELFIPNAAQPLPQITTGGQPSADDLRAASAQGYRTVVSLRGEGEPGSEGEREQVEALGMRFVSIPVTGADDVTLDNARKLAEALGQSDALPAIVHCASGNRAGALLAMKAFHVDGLSAEEAMSIGRRAGLTKLEAAVEQRLVAP